MRWTAAEALGNLSRPEGLLLRRLLCFLGYRWYLPWNLPCALRAWSARRRGYDQEVYEALWRLVEKEAG